MSEYRVNADACAFCAKCHYGCPTYEATQYEGYSARGKILLAAAIAAGRNPEALLASRRMAECLDFCLRCYHCLDVCPAHISTVQIFEALKFAAAESQPAPHLLRILMRYILPSRSIMRLAANVAVISAALPSQLSAAKFTPRLLEALSRIPPERWPPSLARPPRAISALGRQVNLPAMPGARRQAMKAIQSAQSKAHSNSAKIGIFFDCLTDIYYPSAFAGLARFAKANGLEVVANMKAGCCGASALNTGDKKAFQKMAHRYFAAYSNAPYSQILFTNPTCYKTVKERYPEVLGGKAASLPEPILDVRYFTESPPAQLDEAWAGIKVAWNNPCALGYALGDKTSAQSVLCKWGLSLVDARIPGECCGYGGLFSLRYPETASTLSEKKLRIWHDAGADVVLTCSSGCVSHLNATASAHGIPLPALHWGELL